MVSSWTWQIWKIWMGFSSRSVLKEPGNVGLSGLPGHMLGMYRAKLAQGAQFLGSPILTVPPAQGW